MQVCEACFQTLSRAMYAGWTMEEALKGVFSPAAATVTLPPNVVQVSRTAMACARRPNSPQQKPYTPTFLAPADFSSLPKVKSFSVFLDGLATVAKKFWSSCFCSCVLGGNFSMGKG